MMEDNKVETEDELTCSICVHVYQEPVSLPCSHTYCRQCLTAFAEKSQITKTDDSDSTRETQNPVIISCPVCRSPADLGSEGVTGLSVNVTVDEAVRKFQKHMKCEENSAFCSMCEEENITPAVKYCPACGILYCESCLPIVHPMRGPLKRHQLITVEEYLSLGDGLDPSQTDSQSDLVPKCQQHRQSYSMFCVTCEQLICNDCFADDHDGHSFSQIKSAFEKHRAPLLEKVKQCEEMKNVLTRCGGNNEDLKSDIEINETGHISEMEKAYKTAQAALEDWRQRIEDGVKTKHEDWILECDAMNKDISMKLEEINRIIEAFKELSSSHHTVFLQGSKQLTTRINNELPATKTTVKHQAELKKKLENCLKLHPVIPRLVVKELSTKLKVSGPVLKFINTSDSDRSAIKDNGSTLQINKSLYWGYYSINSWTDGRFQTGRHYWELDINPCICAYSSQVYVTIGLSHVDSTIVGSTPGAITCGVKLNYSVDSFQCECLRNKDILNPEYKKHSPFKWPHRLGFYLSCEDRTLIITDSSHNKLISTITSIDVSKFLVPALSAHVAMHDTVIARLISREFNCLPEDFQVILQTSNQ